MRLPLTAALVALTLLSACAGFRDSRINPLNWFAKSEPAMPVALVAEEAPDPRALVAQVLTMTVEPHPGGALVTATGLPPTQGWWSAELVAQPIDENGVLVLEFRVFPPVGTTPVVNQQSREVTVAYAITAFKLASVTKVVVQGANNARSTIR